MNKLIIMEYMNRIKKEDINNFSLKQGINISKKDLDIIYEYIKNDARRILNNPIDVINEIKDKVSYDVYIKILELYDKYKNKIS